MEGLTDIVRQALVLQSCQCDGSSPQGQLLPHQLQSVVFAQLHHNCALNCALELRQLLEENSLRRKSRPNDGSNHLALAGHWREKTSGSEPGVLSKFQLAKNPIVDRLFDREEQVCPATGLGRLNAWRRQSQRETDGTGGPPPWRSPARSRTEWRAPNIANQNPVHR